MSFNKFIFWLLIIFVTPFKSASQHGVVLQNQHVSTVEELWLIAPERIRNLFQALDLDAAHFQSTKQLLLKGDTIAAVLEIVDYFQKTDRDWVFEEYTPMSITDAHYLAKLLIADTVYFHGEKDFIRRGKNGSWKWNHTGPKHDDEFGYSLNGHSFLAALYLTWLDTSITAYIQKLDQVIIDWVLKHPLPAPQDSIYLVLAPGSTLDWRDIGEVEWRTLEAGKRLGETWPMLFYGLQNEPSFSPLARILMLSSIADQAQYLRHHHKSAHNWTTMEMNGLALAGLAFPEFQGARDWVNYAEDIMKKEINRQVYPDGVQTELSTKTQWVALHRFEMLADNFSKAGQPLEQQFCNRLAEMYNYLAYSMRPDGHQPLNNDSDREDIKERVLQAANKFKRVDWQWLATNGEQGKAPNQGLSVTFPWAGIHISRGGGEKSAAWSFFDLGPYGTGHQHRDMLHLSISNFGRDWLVDGGRYTHQNYFSFDPAVWRGYFRSSHAHNVILFDDNGQKAGQLITKKPLVEGVDYFHQPDFDFAIGTFQNGYENIEDHISHTRSVFHLKNHFWIVVDQVTSDRPHKAEVLWHFAPDLEIIMDGLQCVSLPIDSTSIHITPLGDNNWTSRIVSGQEKPHFQGWYSETYGKKEMNPTVIYSTNVNHTSCFAWFIQIHPGTKPVYDIAEMELRKKKVFFSIKSQKAVNISITLPLKKKASQVKLRYKH